MFLYFFFIYAQIYAVGEANLEKKIIVVSDPYLRKFFQIFDDKITVQNEGEYKVLLEGSNLILNKNNEEVFKGEKNLMNLKKIYEKITKENSFIFEEKFYGLCGKPNSKIKEIYQWDILGNIKKISSYNKDLLSLSVFGEEALFSMYVPKLSYYKRKKFIYKKLCLYKLDFKNNYSEELFCHETLQSNAKKTPWGLLYTLSKNGYSQIYLDKTPLTEGRFIDVDPILDEEKNLYFVSSRSGYPMIFKKNIQGKIEQITFTGQGISRPVFLKDYIYFSVLYGSKFQAYRIHKTGLNLEKVFKENISAEEIDAKENFFIFQKDKTVALSRKDSSYFFEWNFKDLNCQSPRFYQ